ncbi:MAG TPA: FAD-dependent oxidoreductase [Tepidisphaeraceae bacterium]|nr:FAD-dependent oxidoreductase [Tepidisphaeraceae bacterium]
MSRHVAIVGAGVIGLCVGYYLARRGHRVTILDRFGPDDQGCSFGNAGMVVPSHFVPLAAPGMVAMAMRMMLNRRSPFYIRPRLDRELFDWLWKFHRAANARHVSRCAPILRDLHLASRACCEELADRPGNNFGLSRTGLLMLCKTARTLEEETHTATRAQSLGIAAQTLDSRQAALMEPNIAMDIAGAVFYPKDCHVVPGRLMSLLRECLGEMGAAQLWRAPVTAWRVRDATIQAACTVEGEIAADEFVLCAGVWSSASVRDLGIRLPMQAGKGYSLTLPKPPKLPRICAILAEARVAVTPMDGSLRFGGTMEIAGIDRSVNRERVDGILQSIPRYYPELSPNDFAGIQPWSGLRPCSPDGMPYVGRTARVSNLCIATGHAMMGISLAPITGKLIAQLLSNEPPEINLHLLDPDRFENRGR